MFDPIPPGGGDLGGDPAEHVFEQSLDTFVREVLQNSRDQWLDKADPAHVQFDFFELEDERRDGFLEAMDWSGLKPHLEGTIERRWLSSERIQRELDEIEHRGQLRILRITDSNTKGLTGDEWEQQTNFKSLCRDILTRPETGDGQGGGAFGLGKAVLWAYSGVATVIFFSELSVPETGGSRRLFGRSNLASHDTADNRKWAGQGYFGEEAIPPHSPEPTAVSVWEPPGDVLESLLVSRDESPGSGTSILIFDFDEPDHAHDRDLVEIAGDLKRSVVKWFWPSLVEGSLIVDVRVVVGDQIRFDEQIDEPGEEVGPYVDAWRCSREDTVERLQNVGDVHHSTVTIDVPKRVNNLTGPAEPAGESKATLRLIAATENPDISGTVALVRGSGMVVEYRACPTFPDLGFSVCGVLRAGESNDESDDGNRRLEAFLRAAEPPAHNTWSHITRRIRADYPNGRWGALHNFFESIKSRVREASSPDTPTSGLTVPSALAKLLKIDDRGVTPPEGKLTVIVTSYSFNDGVWEVAGSVSNSRPTPSWNVRLSFHLDSEGGKPAMLSVAQGTANGTPTTPTGPNNQMALAAISGSRADFTLVSTKSPDLNDVISQARCVVAAQLTKSIN